MKFGRNIQKTLESRVCMFQFPCRFAFFINRSSFRPDTKNNANFNAVSSKRGNSHAFSKKGTILILKLCMNVKVKMLDSL